MYFKKIAKPICTAEFRKWITHGLHKICLFCKISIYTVLILSSCREEKDEKNDFDKKRKRTNK